jgi:molybdenum cofactor guanylyltransferase
MILGAVLAGGRSSRFGSDKALALLDGRSLLDHAVATLRDQCDAVVVVGRDHPAGVSDWPAPHAGPLGGIAGALHHALASGFRTVLTCGVDSVGLPDDLVARLGPAPAYLEVQPVVGHWPAQAAGALEELLCGTGKHSMRAFAARIGARAVRIDRIPANVNTPADLAGLEARHGL